MFKWGRPHQLEVKSEKVVGLGLAMPVIKYDLVCPTILPRIQNTELRYCNTQNRCIWYLRIGIYQSLLTTAQVPQMCVLSRLCSSPNLCGRHTASRRNQRSFIPLVALVSFESPVLFCGRSQKYMAGCDSRMHKRSKPSGCNVYNI